MTVRAALDLLGAVLLALGLCAPLGPLAAPCAALFALGALGAERAVEVLLHARLWWVAALLGLLLLRLNARPVALPPAATDPFPARVRPWLRLLALGAIAVALALFVEHSLRWPDGDWDAWANWNTRARFLHRGASAEAFLPHLWHADYPFLVPAVVAQVWDLLGRDTKAAPAGVALLWGGLGASVAARAAGRLRGGSAGWLTAGLIAATPWYVILTWNQYADLPLAAYLVSAVALLAFAVDSDDWRLPLLAGVAAGMATFCKNEGLLVLAAVFAALLISKRSARGAVAFASGALPLLLLLWAHKRATTARNDFAENFALASLRGVLDSSRWATIGDEARLYLLDFTEWGPMLLAAPVAVALAWRTPADARARPVGAAVAALALAYLVVYLTTPLDLRWHVHGSIDRLAGQLWPALLLWLVLRHAPRAALRS
jgi:hypothetical protein